MPPANSDSPTKDASPAGILETVVYCLDLEQARHFYEHVLGLDLLFVEPERHLFFRVGRGMLLVFNPQSTSETEVHVGGSLIPQHGATGASHFALQVERGQLDAVRDNLSAHDVEIESEIDWPGGGHSIYCRDPSGNSVEFATRTLWFPSEDESDEADRG